MNILNIPYAVRICNVCKIEMYLFELYFNYFELFEMYLFICVITN